MQGIYKIVNGANGKYYVGSSIDVERRWRGHRKSLENGDHYDIYLQRAWNKYGEGNFEFRFVEEVEKEKGRDLCSVEQNYLDEGFALGILYNVSKNAAAPMGGRNHSEETKRKQSKATKRLWTPERRKEQGKRISGKDNPSYGRDMSGKNNPMYGRDMSGEKNPMCGPGSEKAIQKVKESWTLERRRKHSKRMSGKKNPNYGKHITEEQRVAAGRKNAKPYPAFLNIKVGKFIPAGKNLLKLCRERNLKYHIFASLKSGDTKKSHDSWRLATEEEENAFS